MTFPDYLKKIFWFFARPFYPLVRDTGRFFGYSPGYPPRQNYHLGYLAPGKTPQEFYQYLLSQGFKKNKIAWIDDEELWGMRFLENFHYQYHLRLFKDGEIRGHYELTPEYGFLRHLHDEGVEPRTKDFKKFLGNYLIENKQN